MLSIKLHRNELIKQFQDVRNISEFLAEYLDVEDYVNQSADFESPVN